MQHVTPEAGDRPRLALMGTFWNYRETQFSHRVRKAAGDHPLYASGPPRSSEGTGRSLRDAGGEDYVWQTAFNGNHFCFNIEVPWGPRRRMILHSCRQQVCQPTDNHERPMVAFRTRESFATFEGGRGRLHDRRINVHDPSSAGCRAHAGRRGRMGDLSGRRVTYATPRRFSLSGGRRWVRIGNLSLWGFTHLNEVIQ